MLISQPKTTINKKVVYRAEDRVFCGYKTLDINNYPSSRPASYIPDLVANCDKSGFPATLTITFYLTPNKKITTVTIPILPTVIENNKLDSNLMQLYTLCEDHDDTIQKTKTEKKKNPKAFRESAKDNSNKAILFLQRELCMKYLELKANPHLSKDDLSILKAIENLAILKHLNLADIKPENIHFKKLKGLNYNEDSRTADFNDVYRYSIVYQQQHAGTNDVEILSVGENYTIVGLQKGSYPEEIKSFATIDAIANQVIFDKNVLDRSIIYAYSNHAQKPKPSEPSSNK